MTVGISAALIIVGAVALACGAGWARCRRAWQDYRGSIATMRANRRNAWWHIWSMARIGAITVVALMIVVTILRH